jgi:hypothetical protein
MEELKEGKNGMKKLREGKKEGKNGLKECIEGRYK